MRAILCKKYGGPDVLELQNITKPTPKQDELLIRVSATAVTTAGLLSRKGRPLFIRLFNGFKKPKNNILGMEFSGTVEQVGNEVILFNEGDSVFGLTGMKLGANAEYISISKNAAITKKPRNMSHIESASIIEGGVTSLNFLTNKANIKRGQKILIYGASGSIGTAAIQIAKHHGAIVTGVCSNRNFEMVKSLGANKVLDYEKEKFIGHNVKYDIIFDTLGKLSFISCKKSLSQNGIYLDTNGAFSLFHMLWTHLFRCKRKAILAASYMRKNQEIKMDLILLRHHIEDKRIKSVVDRAYTMENIVKAHEYVETKRKRGNVVVYM